MIQYYLLRAHGNLELLEQLDLVGRTAELAKLFGIQGGFLWRFLDASVNMNNRNKRGNSLGGLRHLSNL